MRVFVAVYPPMQVRKTALAAARDAVGDLEERLRWTPPGKVHLTLKFLGDVTDEELQGLRAALRGVCAQHTPFDASLASIGAFPSERRARIVWAGTGSGSEELRALASDVEAAFVPLGFARESRAYVPHATLGRVRGKPVKLGLPAAVPREPGFGVTRVALVKSTLLPQGSVYEILETRVLGSD